jgi:hypothetical protein
MYVRADSWSGNNSKSWNVEMVILLMTFKISHKPVRESNI